MNSLSWGEAKALADKILQESGSGAVQVGEGERGGGWTASRQRDTVGDSTVQGLVEALGHDEVALTWALAEHAKEQGFAVPPPAPLPTDDDGGSGSSSSTSSFPNSSAFARSPRRKTAKFTGVYQDPHQREEEAAAVVSDLDVRMDAYLDRLLARAGPRQNPPSQNNSKKTNPKATGAYSSSDSPSMPLTNSLVGPQYQRREKDKARESARTGTSSAPCAVVAHNCGTHGRSATSATRYNRLQREVFALASRGQSFIMTAGRHSGRCTCAALLCLELFLDYSVPLSLAPPIVILCGVHQQRRLCAMLEGPILEGRVTLLTDLDYQDRPFDVVLSPPLPPRVVAGEGKDRCNDGEPVFIAVGNVSQFDAGVIAEAYSRFEHRPQLVVLLDEGLPSLDAALINVGKSYESSLSPSTSPARSRSNNTKGSSGSSSTLLALSERAGTCNNNTIVRLTLRSTVHVVVSSLYGAGQLAIPTTEEKKYNALKHLFAQLFEYDYYFIVCATRRKAEKLSRALALNEGFTSVAVLHRAPQTVASAMEALENTIRYNEETLLLKSESPSGPFMDDCGGEMTSNAMLDYSNNDNQCTPSRNVAFLPLLRRRLAIVCDLLALPSTASSCSLLTRMDAVVYYDVPEPVSSLERISRVFMGSQDADSSANSVGGRRTPSSSSFLTRRRELSVKKARLGRVMGMCMGATATAESRRLEQTGNIYDPGEEQEHVSLPGSAFVEVERRARGGGALDDESGTTGSGSGLLEIALIDPSRTDVYREMLQSAAMRWVTVDL